jgi:hypothetical protein
LRKAAKSYCIVVVVWSGSGRFALSFHTTSTSLGQGLLGLENTRGEERACRGKKERKISSLSPLLSGSYL